MALPRGAMGLSAVCDCGISRSYSLTKFILGPRPYLIMVSSLFVIHTIIIFLLLSVPGGFSDIFIRRLRSFFGGSKFLISIFLGFSEKMNNFWGYEDFVDIFFGGGGGGSSQNWTIFRGHFKAFYGLS